jgi:hypothetical protein
MASRCKTVFEASGTLRARVSLRESIRQPGTFMSKRCMRTPIYKMVMEEVRCERISQATLRQCSRLGASAYDWGQKLLTW